MKNSYDIVQLKNKLAEKGYRKQWAHSDQSRYEYAEHTHPVDTAYCVISGSMVVCLDGKECDIEEGDFIEVPKNIAHTAKIGSKGCTFLIGAKI